MTDSKHLCIVSIDICTQLLLPANKGLQLVALLQSAQLVELDYATARSDGAYEVKEDAVRVEYRAVKGSQIRQRSAASRSRTTKTKAEGADV